LELVQTTFRHSDILVELVMFVSIAAAADPLKRRLPKITVAGEVEV
jgi:hypothetical protein